MMITPDVKPRAPGPVVPLVDQLQALEDEIPFAVARLSKRAAKGKVHPGFAINRERQLLAALETFRRLSQQLINKDPT